MAHRPGLSRLLPGWQSLAGTLLVCAIIAMMLAAYVPGVGGTASAWTHSLCIGLLGYTIIEVGRRLLWPVQAPHPAGLLALCVLGMTVAFVGGAYLAAWLLGQDAGWLTGADGPGVLAASVLATVVATIFVAGASWVRHYTAALRWRGELEQARAQAAHRSADDAQLRLLRAQLEPHMLFNTLATLRALIAVDPVRAQRMLDQLVAFLRGTLAGSQADHIALREEFALLQDYLGLMAVRMGERLDYALDLPAALADVRVPPLLLQPLVENAIRHGIEPSPGGGRIIITAARVHDGIVLTVTDTGVGMDPLATIQPAPDALPGHGGFGLDAARARLKAAFGQKAELALTSPWPAHADTGARVMIHLPLNDASPP